MESNKYVAQFEVRKEWKRLSLASAPKKKRLFADAVVAELAALKNKPSQNE
ncbi:MAG: hypothetical protein LBS09_04585 [Bacteroidales bacterium]|jgi:uncharacterized protein YqiB (DUF1249 family)|nr:hypothetical protein [Bacteroidales bacterium]